MKVETDIPVPGVVERTEYRGEGAPHGAPPDLLIEIPHGSTRTAEFDALRARLRGPFPDRLADFFHVNTDAGAPELADALARALVTAFPTRSVLVLRSCIPRTFIDCNRDIAAAPGAFREGKVTPGVPPYVRDPDDLALLHGLYAAWREVTVAAFEAVCGAQGRGHGGRALMLHTYAPRSVDVEVDADIVAALRAAYVPEVYAGWQVRPEVDLIARTLNGALMVDAGLVVALRAAFRDIGVTMALGETYPMHPSTLAYGFATRYPGRTMCLEVRRDLMAAPFTPFEEMVISPTAVGRLAGAISGVVEGWIDGQFGPAVGVAGGA